MPAHRVEIPTTASKRWTEIYVGKGVARTERGQMFLESCKQHNVKVHFSEGENDQSLVIIEERWGA